MSAQQGNLKVCTRCRHAKALDCFGRDKNCRDGLRIYCSSCISEISREARKRRDTKNPNYQKEYRSINPERPEKQRNRNYVRKYGFTIAQYEDMLAAQGGACLLCRAEPGTPRAWGRRLTVDHDHDCCPSEDTCGECIRGLICAPCNTALGMAMDDPVLLIKMADYVLNNGVTTQPLKSLKQELPISVTAGKVNQ